VTKDFIPGSVYPLEQVADSIGFQPGAFHFQGGIILTANGPTLIITNPKGGQAIDYEDQWLSDGDGRSLLYTGSGQVGDQTLTGRNKVVSEGRPLLVFEQFGKKRLAFLGHARCTHVLEGRAPDRNGSDRRIYRFRLDFTESESSKASRRAKYPTGESERHKTLKHYIERHPEFVECSPEFSPRVEHSFVSGDRADLVFIGPDGTGVAVEIELEGEAETLTGAWQAAKYACLLAIQLEDPSGKQARGWLVAHNIPDSTRQFCERFGIGCVMIPEHRLCDHPV